MMGEGGVLSFCLALTGSRFWEDREGARVDWTVTEDQARGGWADTGVDLKGDLTSGVRVSRTSCTGFLSPGQIEVSGDGC